MTDRVMIDSNVWIYAFMKGNDERIKIASTLIEEIQSIVLSTQIVNEVCNVLLRKKKVSNTAISNYIDYFYNGYSVVLLDETILRLASDLRIEHLFSFWDSLIIASAIDNQCDVLYSEDMQHNMLIKNTQIINPFDN